MTTTKQTTIPAFIGTLCILASALAFGSYGVFSRYLGAYDIFFQTYVRCFLVALVLGGYGLLTHQFKKIQPKDYGWFAVVLVFTSFSIAPITYSYRFLTLGTAAFLFYSSVTVFTYLFGFLFFKEKWTPVKLISLGLSLVGMLLIFSLQLTALLLVPAVLAIFTGLATSGEVTFSKKISGMYSSTQITFLVFAVIGVSHLILSLLLGENQNIGIVSHSLPVLLLFVFAAIVGMISVVEGFKRVEPSIGAVLGLTEIVFSVVLGIVLFSESLSSGTILGGALILIAALLPNIAPLQRYWARRSQLNASV